MSLFVRFRALALAALCCAWAVTASLAQDGEPVAPEHQEDVFKVYCWADYFAAATLADFEKEAGIKIELHTYESNEELETQLLSGHIGVDVLFPSDYMVKQLSDQDLLAALDLKQIPNVKNLNPRFLKLPFDRNNRFSLPYMWGTTGIGANRSKVSSRVDTFGVLFEEAYKGKIMMLDDPRTCMGIALKLLGKSANTRKKDEIQAAKELLLKQKPLVLKYSSNDYSDALADGKILLALGFNGDVMRARKKNMGIFYSVPDEGTILWTDNMCIHKGSEHVAIAHKFLDYLLRPEVSAAITNETFYPSPNVEAEKLVKPEILKDRSIFPTRKVMEKSEFLESVGSAEELYEAAWAEITGQ